MADTVRDGGNAFADEAEPTVTIGEYIEGIEAEELVRYPASPSLARRIRFVRVGVDLVPCSCSLSFALALSLRGGKTPM